MCSVHWGVFSTSWNHHEYIRGISWVHQEDIRIHVEEQVDKSLWFIPQCTEHPPMYSWYPPWCMEQPPIIHDIPPMYRTVPDVLMMSPDILNIPHVLMIPLCIHPPPPPPMYWTHIIHVGFEPKPVILRIVICPVFPMKSTHKHGEKLLFLIPSHEAFIFYSLHVTVLFCFKRLFCWI